MNDYARTTTVIPLVEKASPIVGTTLKDRYVLEQLLGEGGMGRVFLATDTELPEPNRLVAIKMLRDSFVREHPQMIDVLRREAAVARELANDNIVRVYTFEREGPHHFIVMEYIRGESLDHFIKRHKGGAGLAEAWPTIRDCANALSYMHQHKHKIVHMDFKPGNVFCTEDGETKVLDLGLARSGNETRAVKGRTLTLTAPRSEQPVWLTPEYASCEMFLDNHQPDPRDDIYAFGCVVYELLTGRHPFRSSNGSAVWAPNAKKEGMTPVRPKGLGRRQWRALQKALAFDRAERLPNMERFLAEFDPKPVSPRPWWLLTLALVMIAATAVAFLRPMPSPNVSARPVLTPDEQFIDAVVRSNPVSGHKPAKPGYEQGWQDQARIGLELGQEALDEGNYEDAEHFLDDGPTSVRFSLERLVKTASTEKVLRDGASMLLSLSKLYAKPAEALRTSNSPEALRWTCGGLDINRYEKGLQSLYAALRQTVHGDVPLECEAFEQAQHDAASKTMN